MLGLPITQQVLIICSMFAAHSILEYTEGNFRFANSSLSKTDFLTRAQRPCPALRVLQYAVRILTPKDLGQAGGGGSGIPLSPVGCAASTPYPVDIPAGLRVTSWGREGLRGGGLGGAPVPGRWGAAPGCTQRNWPQAVARPSVCALHCTRSLRSSSFN